MKDLSIYTSKIIFYCFLFLICLALFNFVPNSPQYIINKITTIITMAILSVGIYCNGYIIAKYYKNDAFNKIKNIVYINIFSLFSMLVMYGLYEYGFETTKEHVSQFGFNIATISIAASVIVSTLSMATVLILSTFKNDK